MRGCVSLEGATDATDGSSRRSGSHSLATASRRETVYSLFYISDHIAEGKRWFGQCRSSQGQAAPHHQE